MTQCTAESDEDEVLRKVWQILISMSNKVIYVFNITTCVSACLRVLLSRYLCTGNLSGCFRFFYRSALLYREKEGEKHMHLLFVFIARCPLFFFCLSVDFQLPLRNDVPCM